MASRFTAPGIEVIIKPDGSVWVQEYNLAPGATPEPWREASETERIAAFVLASRRIPEFHALVPERPASAPSCTQCEGTGFLFAGAVICKRCGALGWLAEEAT